ncbi:PIN domain-containing protein [Oscillatoria amoena NRMC-F 0135]|nr:PIN domain-containing protein [Oscillatoria amoena NRMC-F 0135]
MIFPDVNILLYSINRDSLPHRKILKWWQNVLSGNEPVALSWHTINGFIRLSTNFRVFPRPLSPDEAFDHVQAWIDSGNTTIITPTSSHLRIYRELVVETNCTANLTADAHLAALAIEHDAVFYTTDNDFARFPKLKRANPVS